MKKSIFSFVMVFFLMLSVSNTVFAANAENDSSSDTYDGSLSSLQMDQLGPTSSLQLMFAKLQLEMAEITKQQAQNTMSQIAETQEEQKLVSNLLNTARKCKDEATRMDEAIEMPADMVEYMKANNLSYDTTGDDLLMTGDEWDTAITSLEGRLEELGKQTQQQMVYLQDFMGQYNSYLQGVNTQLSDPNQQTLISLARGQSMYGDSEVGLAITALVVGLVLGCLITLTIPKIRKKKDTV